MKHNLSPFGQTLSVLVCREYLNLPKPGLKKWREFAHKMISWDRNPWNIPEFYVGQSVWTNAEAFLHQLCSTIHWLVSLVEKFQEMEKTRDWLAETLVLHLENFLSFIHSYSSILYCCIYFCNKHFDRYFRICLPEHDACLAIELVHDVWTICVYLVLEVCNFLYISCRKYELRHGKHIVLHCHACPLTFNNSSWITN